jgi:hypothetical protein
MLYAYPEFIGAPMPMRVVRAFCYNRCRDTPAMEQHAFHAIFLLVIFFDKIQTLLSDTNQTGEKNNVESKFIPADIIDSSFADIKQSGAGTVFQ